MSTPLIVLDTGRVAMAASLVGITALVSIHFRLKLERTLAIATLRTVLQLTMVGFLLEWIFSLDNGLAVLPVLLVMTVLAAHAAVGRTERSYPKMRWVALVSIFGSASLVLMFALTAVIGVEPWWSPRYIIPLLGVLLGNMLTGVSLGLDRFVSSLVEKRGEVEALLSHGASRTEAVERLRSEAVRVGLIPIVNAMLVVGTVSLPGVMTGQILSGTSPQTAVAYQMVIMFLLAGATSLATVGVVLASERLLFDARHRPRFERIQKK